MNNKVAKKYIRVSEHLRHVNDLVIIVRAHIRKNPIKKIKLCDACHVPMKFLKKYENESGGEFHTYQCPKCKGKIDFAQIEGAGEFSVHSNIVPKGAEKK